MSDAAATPDAAGRSAREAMPVEQLAVYCADVGSIKQGNFGWARAELPVARSVEEERGGATEIAELVGAVADDLASGLPVALGFECPLFVPVPEDPRRLGAARQGDGTRSFSAGAGPSVLVTGLVQAAWVLRELRDRRPNDDVLLDWDVFEAAGRGLFVWEAFVTAEAKAPTHVDDATVAVECFIAALPDPRSANAVTADRPLSLAGAAVLWAGWTNDLALLHSPCLVLRAAAAAQA
jgi:hypothetical protein